MTAHRLWQLFEQALQLDLDTPEARRAFVQRECGDDAALANELLALLEADEHSEDSFLDGAVVSKLSPTQLRDLKTAGLEEAPDLTSLGQYDLLEMIGEGGMGRVYRGRHRVIGRDVAVKLLSPDLVEDKGLVSRFFEEARVVNAIRHPNIVDVTDFIELSDPPCVAYVMELLHGVPLSKAIKDDSLSLARSINIAWQMLDALEAVHTAGVVHRDLKPDNVFVVGDLSTDLSDVPSVKIVDFGVAKVSTDVGHRTATGTIVGTPAYMAPEQADGQPPGPATDLYAWAEIVYEMITGQRLFTGTTASILHAKLAPDASPLHEFTGDGIPSDLLELLRRALARHPGARPPLSEAKVVLARLGAATGRTRYRTVVAARLTDAAGLAETLGQEGLLDLIRTIESSAQSSNAGQPVPLSSEATETVYVFDDASQAVHFAETLQLRATEEGLRRGVELSAQAGLWSGNLYSETTAEPSTPSPTDEASPAPNDLPSSATEPPDARPTPAQSPPSDLATAAPTAQGPVLRGARHLMRLARPGQTLLPDVSADSARADEAAPSERLAWVCHGRYKLSDRALPFDLYEVAQPGRAAFIPPVDSADVRRIVLDDTFAGWRPAPGLAIPDRVEWVIEKKLGEGGFGEAWLAHSSDTSERHVFKFAFGAAASQALKREAQLIGLIRETVGSRTDILDVRSVQVETAPYYLESAYVPGGELNAWLQTHGANLDINERAELVAQVADALAATHAVGILHRDIKPSNVLVDNADDGPPRLVLSDFGIGGFIQGTDETKPTVPSPGEADTFIPEQTFTANPDGLEGSVLYMSPERLAGRPASLQSDIYALGVLLYQTLVSDFRRPVASDWRDEIEDPLLREDLEVMLASTPERRLNDAAAVAERLRTLEARRQERTKSLERQAAAERARRFRRIAIPVGLGLAIFGIAMAIQAQRIAMEAKRANRAANTASRVSNFLVDLFEVSNPSPERASQITARDLLDRGAARIEGSLNDDPLVRAELMATISRVYENLGLFAPAQELSEQALEVRESQLAPDHPKVADSLAALGDIHRRQSQYEAAERFHRQAIAIRERALGTEHPDTAQSLTTLGQLAYLQGDTKAALENYRRGLAIRERTLGADDIAVAESLVNIAWLTGEEGRYKEAEPLLQRALDIRRRKLGSKDELVAETLSLLASYYTRRGKYDQAETLLQEAIEIWATILEPDHVRHGGALMALGMLQRDRGRTPDSLATLGKALDILTSAFGQQRLEVGMAYFELGLTNEYAEQWTAATEAYRRCLAIYETVLGTDHPSVGQVLNNLGTVLSDRTGQRAEAESIIRRAVAIYQSDDRDLYWQALTRWTLANNLRDQGKLAEADPWYKTAIALLKANHGTEDATAPDLPALVRDYNRLLEAAGRKPQTKVNAAAGVTTPAK